MCYMYMQYLNGHVETTEVQVQKSGKPAEYESIGENVIFELYLYSCIHTTYTVMLLTVVERHLLKPTCSLRH